MSRGAISIALSLVVAGAFAGYRLWEAGREDEAAEASAADAEICRVIIERPGEALMYLHGKVKDATEVWRYIERCHAPDGDACDHALVGLSAMPSMARPTPAQRKVHDAAYLRACRTLPPATQRCLVLSNVLDASTGCAAQSGKARSALRVAQSALTP